jgi:hypothetical protein
MSSPFRFRVRSALMSRYILAVAAVTMLLARRSLPPPTLQVMAGHREPDDFSDARGLSQIGFAFRPDRILNAYRRGIDDDDDHDPTFTAPRLASGLLRDGTRLDARRRAPTRRVIVICIDDPRRQTHRRSR